MKVLIVTTNFPRYEGDPHSPWLVELLGLLRKQGVAADVLAPAYRGQGSHQVHGMQVTRFRYAPARWETLTHEEGAPNKVRRNPLYMALLPFYVLSGLWHTWQMARPGRYDVVHVHWPVPGALFGMMARWRGGGRLVMTFYGSEIVMARRFPLLRQFLRSAVHWSDAIIAISRHTASELTAETGIEPSIIPYGVAVPSAPDAGRFEPGLILTVGRLIARKGHIYLIEAMAALSGHPGAQLVIVGEGHERPALEAAIARLGLAGRVRLAGRVSDEDLQRLYASCQVFVLPGIVDEAGDTEMLGMVLLEAMRYAKPVVCTRVGGTSDIIRDGRNGILVEEKDPAALAGAIARLLDDVGLAAQLGQAGYETARDEFGWPEIVRRTMVAYGID